MDAVSFDNKHVIYAKYPIHDLLTIKKYSVRIKQKIAPVSEKAATHDNPP
jgi:hypothetical protein